MTTAPNRQHHPATAPTAMRGPREYPPAPARQSTAPQRTTPEHSDRAAPAAPDLLQVLSDSIQRARAYRKARKAREDLAARHAVHEQNRNRP